MRIRFQGDNSSETKEIDTDAEFVKELLEERGINPVTHVVSLNGEVVTEDEEIHEGDKIKVQKVVSGG